MIKNDAPYCDLCGHRMLIVTENEDGEEIGFTFERAQAHCHHECWAKEFDRQWREVNPCKTECRTQPCRRGNDCWFNPPIMWQFPYETYYANRIKGRGRKKTIGNTKEKAVGNADLRSLQQKRSKTSPQLTLPF